MVYEVGKNGGEGDGEVAETIDCGEYYAREALRLAKVEPALHLPGERGSLTYIPLGVGAVIPPWNFPCAIAAGMTMAAIVCGNAVVLKPSHDSPIIAARFFEILQEAGMPDGVVNFCPGSGRGFGASLVEPPQTAFGGFTGPNGGGLAITHTAAPSQHAPK